MIWNIQCMRLLTMLYQLERAEVCGHHTYIYLAMQLLCSLTGRGLFLSCTLTRTAKLARCVVVQVTNVLLEWLLSKVTPSIDQPPT